VASSVLRVRTGMVVSAFFLFGETLAIDMIRMPHHPGGRKANQFERHSC